MISSSTKENEALRQKMTNLLVDKEQEAISDFRSGIQSNNLEAASRAIKELWNVYATDGRKPLSKLFESKTIQPIFRSIISTVIALERLGRQLAVDNIAVSSGSSLLISGVRGVGKTMLMEGLTHTLSAACEHVFPVYWDYEQMACKLPVQIILEQLQLRRVEVFAVVKDISNCIELLSVLQSQRIYVAFLADEVQQLYKPNSTRDSFEVECVKQLLSIGKQPNCFGIISSSSANITTLAFKKANSAQYHEYPNLNNTVYAEKRLLPMRDQEELQKLLQVRYPNSTDDTETVFIKTGGVGRNIDRLMKNDVQSSIIDALCKPAFRAVVSRLFLKNEALTRETKISWQQQALSYSEVTDAMKPYVREEDYVRQLNEWVDTGLLYSSNNNYELLLPSDYEVVKSYLTNHPDRLTMMALEGTFRKWDGCGSAGGLIEKYIRTLLFEGQTEYNLPYKITSYNEKCLSVTAGGNHVLFKDVTNHCGELLYFAADQGFDGVVFEKTANGFKIHAMQIKTGGIDKKITVGGPSGEEQGSPDIILGIMKCANDAAKSLLSQLQQLNQKVEFASFTLITNKEVITDAQKVFQKAKLLQRPIQTYLIEKESFYNMFSQAVLDDLGIGL